MTSPRQQPSDDHAGSASRRNLTVLFCDIIGSTALSVRLDPEDLRDILRAFQACCRNAVESNRGFIARYMGDGVLAYFGFPTAHEDDAERAVNAALQMVASISALKFSQTQPLEVRVGIATGIVVVGDLIGEGASREFELIGEAPNLAAALQHSARPNQILVSAQTRRLLGGLFELSDLGERTIKGHDKPIRIWSVLRSTRLRSRFDARRPQQLTPFLGRMPQMAVLRQHWKEAECGRGQIVTVSGEPGIGKSRLIAAFLDDVTRDATQPLLFQCSPSHTSSPWFPIIRHLENASGIDRDMPADLKRDLLNASIPKRVAEREPALVPLLAELLSIPSGGLPAPELSLQQKKRRTLLGLVELMRAQATDAPVVLVIEDAHWIDPTSWELIDALAESLASWRVLLILSFRPEFPTPWAGKPNATQLVLNRLDTAEVTGIINFLSGERSLPKPVVEQIVAKSDGVPLFVEEVTKAVLESGADAGNRGTAARVASALVPDTLHDSLMARLDQLASMKAIAQMAAAIGREFATELLEAVADMPKDDLRTGIERLLDAGLVFRSTQSNAEVYAFKHALVQDAAYSSLLRDNRRALHRRIATALSTKFPNIVETSPEILAHHYEQAQDIEPAIKYLLKAGQQAGKRTAFIEASTHFQTAARVLAQVPESAQRNEIELLIQQGLASASIAVKGFGSAETMQALQRALELCDRSAGTPVQAFAVLNGLAGGHMMRGEFEEFRRVAADLLARAEQHNDKTGLLMGHRVLGMALFLTGDIGPGQEHLQRAIDLYDPPLHAPLTAVFGQDFKASAQIYLSLAMVLRGKIERGLAYGLEALAHAEQLNHPHSICYVLPYLAGAYLSAGMAKDALPFAERAVALSSEHEFYQWLAGSLMIRGWARTDAGDVAGGLSDVRESIEALRATNTVVWMQFAQFILAKALYATGACENAEGLVDRVLSDLNKISGRWYGAEVHRLRGNLRLRAGKPAGEVEACYESAIAIARQQRARLWELRATNDLGDLWIKDERASQLRTRLAPLFDGFSAPPGHPDLARARRLVAASSECP